MPRELECFRDVLQSLQEIAQKLFPGKFIFSKREVAQMLGVHETTIYRRKYSFNSNGVITLERLARDLLK